MITIKAKTLKTAAMIYLAAPTIVFFLGWLSTLPAVIFTVLLAGAVFFSVRSKEECFLNSSLTVSKKTFVLLIVTAFMWCLLAGHGGFMHQSPDNSIRNMIIKDLVRFPWPVTYADGKALLCYYINYWMIPCAAGRAAFLISGSTVTGYAVCNSVMIVWSTIGVFITLALFSVVTCRIKRAKVLISVIIFIFFSGMDIAFATMDFRGHLEWWTDLQYSSTTTCLYWVYNQALAAWIATLCVINEKKVSDLAIVGILCFPFSPLPFVGLLYICIVKGFILLAEHKRSGGKFGAFVLKVFSPQNIMACASVGTVFLLYFRANGMVAGTNTGFRLNDVLTTDPGLESTLMFVSEYVPSVFAEFALLALLLHIYMRKDVLFHFVVGALFVIPLFQLGVSIDFCMRVSIPPLIYLCCAEAWYIQEERPPRSYLTDLKKRIIALPIYVVVIAAAMFSVLFTELGELFYMDSHARILVPFTVYGFLYGSWYLRKKYPDKKIPFKSFKPGLKPGLAAVLIVFFLGMYTPITEMSREIINTKESGRLFLYNVNDSIGDFCEDPAFSNFLARSYEESAFYKYIEKK